MREGECKEGKQDRSLALWTGSLKGAPPNHGPQGSEAPDATMLWQDTITHQPSVSFILIKRTPILFQKQPN